LAGANIRCSLCFGFSGGRIIADWVNEKREVVGKTQQGGRLVDEQAKASPWSDYWCARSGAVRDGWSPK